MRAKGFTLIEVLIAVVLVGLAVAGLVGANRAYTLANGFGLDLTRAELLIEQIRELTMTLPVVDPQTGTAIFGRESGETLASLDDLDDLDGCTFDPPIDAAGNTIPQMAGLAQVIRVRNVNTSNLDQETPPHCSPFVRVTVQILRSGRLIDSATWLRCRY